MPLTKTESPADVEAVHINAENRDYLTRQIITYIGNKRVLLPFILQAVEMVRTRLGGSTLRTADMFSGSGIVARGLRAHSCSMLVNDLEGYSETLAKCYLSSACQRDDKALADAYSSLRQTLEGELREGIISRNYAPRDENRIMAGERCFYTRRNAMYIDTARQEINNLPPEIRHFFLAPLLYEASVKANTAGVFKGFYKNPETGVGQFGGKGRNALTRICADIDMPFPVFSGFNCPTKIFRMDAGQLAGQMDEVDLMYLDPPYNQHPYGSNYFMLNLINDYTQPAGISAVSGIPRGWNRSGYNKRGKALELLIHLCATAPARFLLISMNSEGFVERSALEDGLSAIGRVEVMEKRYNAFRGSRNLRQRDIYTSEYLFLVEKY